MTAKVVQVDFRPCVQLMDSGRCKQRRDHPIHRPATDCRGCKAPPEHHEFTPEAPH